MKKSIILIMIILCISIVLAYTPPSNTAVELVLDISYTPPSNTAIALVLNEVITDTCTCPGSSTAHEFDCSDECSVETCTAGDVTFTGTGTVTCTGAWGIDSLGDPGNGCTLYIDSGCVIDE